MDTIQLVILSGMGIFVMAIGGFLGMQWIKFRSLDANYVNTKISQAKEMMEEYKKDAQHWRGKYGKKVEGLQVEGDYDLNNDSDIGALAKMVLPNLLEFLPSDIAKKAKGFLDNPELIDMGIELYKKHPDEIKSILGKFVKKGGFDATNSNTLGSSSKEIENAFA